MNDFIVDAIFSFGEAMNLVKSPKNEEEYKRFATPYPDKKITKTWEEVVSKSNELKADHEANQYQRDRAVAFDPIPEQLDQIYHDIDGWKARIKSVKDKYPKPSE